MKMLDGLRSVARALGGHLHVPMDVLRAAIPDSDRFAVRVEAAPPGLRLQGNATPSGTALSFSALVVVEGIDYDGDHRRLHLRLRDVTLSTDDDATGPLATAIRDSEARTEDGGDLIARVFGPPAYVTEAVADRIVIDLLAIPRIAEHPHLRALLAVGTSLVGFTAIEVADDALEIELAALPAGAGAAVRSAFHGIVAGKTP